MKNYLKLIRIEQYIKNLFVFAPLFFGKEFLNLSILENVFVAFLLFSLASSSIYIVNDFYDIEEDRVHPIKKNRPLASGKIGVKNALILFCLMIVTTLSVSFFINSKLFIVLLTYVLMNLLYSKWLKHITILDVNIIAFGFVLRIIAGAVVSNVIPSVWIVLITFLLALFIGIAKRRTDVVLYQNGSDVRKNIEGYNLSFIDISLGILASIIIVCYIFYCISPEIMQHYHSNLIYVSILFVINGIFRYLQLAIVNQSTYSPTQIVLEDRFIQITILGWVILMSYLLYFNE